MEEKVQKEDTEEILRNKLKSLERTRNIKVWHDHSDVLNHTYVSFMVSYIYVIFVVSILIYRSKRLSDRKCMTP
jgi:hypothetical protein